MLTKNLEKELLKQNASILSKEQLLAIEQYDKLTQTDDCEILSRAGLNRNIVNGAIAKKELEKAQKVFGTDDRVFHISQIEKLCRKYNLRFLNASFYRGDIDPKLGQKLTAFEAIIEGEIQKRNIFIAAPMESFRLEERPKDPLCFYSLGDEFYYLIHKWGNDLSVFRRLHALVSTHWGTWFATTLSPLLITLSLMLFPALRCDTVYFINVIVGIGFLISTGIFIAAWLSGDDIILGDDSDNWRQSYR